MLPQKLLFHTDDEREYRRHGAQINRNDIGTGVLIGFALNDLERFDEAIQYFDKALAIDPNHDAVLDAKGEALVGLGNYTQAIQYFDRAIAINPNAGVLDNKGRNLNNLNRSDEAIQYFDRALAIDPDNEEALIDKGVALTHLGNYTQAIQYFDRVLAIDPTNKAALYNKDTRGAFFSGQITSVSIAFISDTICCWFSLVVRHSDSRLKCLI